MRIECDDIFNTEVHELLKNICTVKRLASASNLLSAFIQVGHDHVNAVGFSACSSDDTLQILIVIIGRHDIFKTGDVIGHVVVADIDENVQIVASDCLTYASLSFTGAETGS